MLGEIVRDLLGNKLVVTYLDESDSVVIRELAYIHEDGTLSSGRVVVFGSQFNRYTRTKERMKFE